MTREILEQFQGKQNVTKIICDNGIVVYLTQRRSFADEVSSLGASKLNTIENENKHVLFLFNKNDEEVGRYYIGKKLQGKTPPELAEIKNDLVFFDSWNTNTKEWIPCVTGSIDYNYTVKKWKGLRSVFINNKWFVDCGDLFKRYYIVPPGRYDFIDDFDENGLAIVRINKNLQSGIKHDVWGIINEDGEEVIPVSFIEINDISYKKLKVLQLSKYVNDRDYRTTKQYIMDLRYYSINRDVRLYPVDDWYHEEFAQSLLSSAKSILNEEEFFCFKLVIIEMNSIDRIVLQKIWAEKSLSIEDKVRGVLKWNNHWLKVRFLYGFYIYEYVENNVSEFEKVLYFWNMILNENYPTNLNLHFPSEYHFYSEDNLKKLVEYLQNSGWYDSLLEDTNVVNDDSNVFNGFKKQDCVIRRFLQNDEQIYEVLIKGGPKQYYKNVRMLKDILDSMKEPNLELSRAENNTRLILNGYMFLFDNTVKTRHLYQLVDRKESLLVCSFSKDLNEWNDYICKDSIFLTIFNNPVSYISNERVVTQHSFGNWEVRDLLGNVIVPQGKYSRIDGFKCNLAKVKRRNTIINWKDESEEYFDTYGIIDKDGNEIVKCEYDTIYKFYGNDKWYTTMIKNGWSIKFHLGYRTTFGNLSDVEYLRYLEDQERFEIKGCKSMQEEDSLNNYSVWDALDGEPEAWGNLDWD